MKLPLVLAGPIGATYLAEPRPPGRRRRRCISRQLWRYRHWRNDDPRVVGRLLGKRLPILLVEFVRWLHGARIIRTHTMTLDRGRHAFCGSRCPARPLQRRSHFHLAELGDCLRLRTSFQPPLLPTAVVHGVNSHPKGDDRWNNHPEHEDAWEYASLGPPNLLRCRPKARYRNRLTRPLQPVDRRRAAVRGR